MEKLTNNLLKYPFFQKINSFFIKYPVVKKIIKWIMVFIFIWLSYDFLTYFTYLPNDNLQTIRTFMIIPIIYALIRGFYLYGKKELTIDKIAVLLLIIGFTLRCGYAFYTGASTRQHDVEMYNSDGSLNLSGGGHFTYTYILYSTGKLPSSVNWQFYHPPLFHATSALFMHIYSFFEGTKDVATLYNATIIVSSFIGCLTLYFIKRLIFEITSNNVARFIMLLLMTLHPQFFIMSGWVNNDSMAFMFMIISLYYGFVFHKNRSWYSIILCAIALGLGAMSKLVAGLVCIPLGIIFIYDFIIDIKNKTYKKTILQGISFIGIVCPLALWFIIRTYIKFGVSALDVPSLNPYSNSLGVINYSYWQRFGIPNLANLSNGLFCILRPNSNNYQDYNVWLYTFKCSVFGEYSYWQGDLFGVMLLVSNILMILITLICIIYCLIKNIKSFNNILMLVTFITCIVAYLIFQVKHPVTCTQDFRYMTLILIPGIYFIGTFFESEFESKSMKTLKYTFLIVIFAFVSSSCLYYLSCR